MSLYDHISNGFRVADLGGWGSWRDLGDFMLVLIPIVGILFGISWWIFR
jgi:hypothetical protein